MKRDELDKAKREGSLVGDDGGANMKGQYVVEEDVAEPMMVGAAAIVNGLHV